MSAREEPGWNSSDSAAACDPSNVSIESGIACGGMGMFPAPRGWRLSCLIMVRVDQVGEVRIPHLGGFFVMAQKISRSNFRIDQYNMIAEFIFRFPSRYGI
jgi:hypothetical protein